MSVDGHLGLYFLTVMNNTVMDSIGTGFCVDMFSFFVGIDPAEELQGNMVTLLSLLGVARVFSPKNCTLLPSHW